MSDAGADHVLDFVDVGLPSTVCPPDEYEEALELYYNREFDAAQARLFSVMQRNPRDKVAWHHLVNATRLADNGAPEGWTGVTVMTNK